MQGIWKPRKIENPDFFEDKEPFKMTPIVSMKNKILYCYSSTDYCKLLFDEGLLSQQKKYLPAL